MQPSGHGITRVTEQCILPVGQNCTDRYLPVHVFQPDLIRYVQ
jgi:hypothetical protein